MAGCGVRRRGLRGARRMARSVTSSALGCSAWKPWYAPHTRVDHLSGRPATGGLDSFEEPLVAEALARRCLGVVTPSV